MAKQSSVEIAALYKAAEINSQVAALRAAGEDLPLNSTDPQANAYGFLGSLFGWKANSNVATFAGVITEISVESAQMWLEEMDGKFDQLVLNFTSPGGFGSDGVALANMFWAAKSDIICNITGMAYSAGSVAIQGCTERNVLPGAFIGIHRSWSLTIGDTEVHAKVAEDLAFTDGLIAEIYAMRVPAEKMDEVNALVAEDTRMNGKRAVELGLADAALDKDQAREKMRGKEKATPEEQKSQALALAEKNVEELGELKVRLETAAGATEDVVIKNRDGSDLQWGDAPADAAAKAEGWEDPPKQEAAAPAPAGQTEGEFRIS